jgi:hypothetical protein
MPGRKCRGHGEDREGAGPLCGVCRMALVLLIQGNRGSVDRGLECRYCGEYRHAHGCPRDLVNNPSL